MITVAELNTVAPDDVVNAIIDDDNTIVSNIIEETSQMMKSYLHHRYDTDAIFSATGDDRHADIVRMMKDIVIYHLYTRRTRDTINEVAMHRYDHAIRELREIAKGVIHPQGLPLLSQTSSSVFFAGGKPHDTTF